MRSGTWVGVSHPALAFLGRPSLCRKTDATNATSVVGSALCRTMSCTLRCSILMQIAATNFLLSAFSPLGQRPALATDLAIVPLFDSRHSEPLNTWGGHWSVGRAQQGIGLGICDAGPSGQHALSIDFRQIKADETRYVQCFASGFGRSGGYFQTRDLSRYRRLRLRVRNSTGVAIHGSLQVKDHRDTARHSATYRYELPGLADWTVQDIPLSLDEGRWTIEGDPDLSRTLVLDFLFRPSGDVAAGQVHLADVALVETGGPAIVETSPLSTLVERVARRQWDGLWAARNRTHGLIPKNSYQATDAALNTTAGVLWMLPAAAQRHWVDQAEADSYAALLTDSVNTLLDRAAHLPPRYVDWVTLKLSPPHEESSVDAAFLSLALYQYQSLASTPPRLRAAIARTRDRFDFAAFASAGGWRMAYRRQPSCPADGFLPLTYDAYTSEGHLISLAAHLTPGKQVAIETNWSRGMQRVRLAGLAPSQDGPVVHPMAEYRAPFTQALWNLFVDVRQRGVDVFPDQKLAANPWRNFVCYEQNVMAKLAELKRPCLVQPDAGDDGTLDCYRQFSVYDCCGQTDLFMPWSASLALLSGVDQADTAFRFVLQHRLTDCFGLADSARWTTGRPEPEAVVARHDFWNTCLSTMALLEWLDGPNRLSRSFAALPDVRGALDRVFLPATEAGTDGWREASVPAARPHTPREGAFSRSAATSAIPARRS